MDIFGHVVLIVVHLFLIVQFLTALTSPDNGERVEVVRPTCLDK